MKELFTASTGKTQGRWANPAQDHYETLQVVIDLRARVKELEDALEDISLCDNFDKNTIVRFKWVVMIAKQALCKEVEHDG